VGADDLKVPNLSILLGEGRPAHKAKPFLTVVPYHRAPPQQLDLFDATLASRKIVSVGIDGLDLECFAHIVASEKIRRVIDMRLSPSFLGRGFSPENVRSLLQRADVAYEHVPALANRYIGDSWDDTFVLQKYATYIRAQHGALQQLNDRIANGPILLLGRTPAHAFSSRAVLVNALLEVGSSFVLRIVEKADFCSFHAPYGFLEPLSIGATTCSQSLEQNSKLSRNLSWHGERLHVPWGEPAGVGKHQGDAQEE